MNIYSDHRVLTQECIEFFFDGIIVGIAELTLTRVAMLPSGRGHFKFEVDFDTDQGQVSCSGTTSNSMLVDDFQSAMNDEPMSFYESKCEITSSILSAVKADSKIYSLTESI